MKQVEMDNNEDYGAQFLSVPVVGMDERTSFFCLARGWLTGYVVSIKSPVEIRGTAGFCR